jgi:hypothetical protein
MPPQTFTPPLPAEEPPVPLDATPTPAVSSVADSAPVNQIVTTPAPTVQPPVGTFAQVTPSVIPIQVTALAPSKRKVVLVAILAVVTGWLSFVKAFSVYFGFVALPSLTGPSVNYSLVGQGVGMNTVTALIYAVFALSLSWLFLRNKVPAISSPKFFFGLLVILFLLGNSIPTYQENKLVAAVTEEAARISGVLQKADSDMTNSYTKSSFVFNQSEYFAPLQGEHLLIKDRAFIEQGLIDFDAAIMEGPTFLALQAKRDDDIHSAVEGLALKKMPEQYINLMKTREAGVYLISDKQAAVVEAGVGLLKSMKGVYGNTRYLLMER